MAWPASLRCLSSLIAVRCFVVTAQLPEIFKAVLSSPPSRSESGVLASEAVEGGRSSSQVPLLSSSGEDLRPYLRPCAPSSQQPSAEEAAGAKQHASAEPRGNGREGGWTTAWPAAHTLDVNIKPDTTGSGRQWLLGDSTATASSWAGALVVAATVVLLAGFEAMGKRPWPRSAWYPIAAAMSPSISLLDVSPVSSRSSSFSAGGKASPPDRVTCGTT